jgi:hypothetical protein
MTKLESSALVPTSSRPKPCLSAEAMKGLRAFCIINLARQLQREGKGAQETRKEIATIVMGGGCNTLQRVLSRRFIT